MWEGFAFTSAQSAVGTICESRRHDQTVLHCFFNNKFPAFPRHHFRYNAVLLRAEFDQHKNERDMIKVKKLMEDAEYQLWNNQHYQPKQCMYMCSGIPDVVRQMSEHIQ